MSVSHYPITLTKANSFVFVTEWGYTYFDRETGIFPDERIDQYSVFLGFTCFPALEIFKRSYDPKVGDTIMFIVANFFQANPRSILSYVCSAVGGQERQRQISFSRWYNSSPLKERYKLLKRSFGTTYCGILYSMKHPEIDMIEDLFMDFDMNMKPGVMEDEAPYYLMEEEEE